VRAEDAQVLMAVWKDRLRLEQMCL